MERERERIRMEGEREEREFEKYFTRILVGERQTDRIYYTSIKISILSRETVGVGVGWAGEE